LITEEFNLSSQECAECGKFSTEYSRNYV